MARLMNKHVIIPPPAVDVPRAQVDAITCMIDIIDEPYTGDDLRSAALGTASDARDAEMEQFIEERRQQTLAMIEKMGNPIDCALFATAAFCAKDRIEPCQSIGNAFS
jgi:hypothetical protein